MTAKYLTYARYEKNSSNGLELHDTPEDAVEALEQAQSCGALFVELYECRPVDYVASRQIKVNIVDPGKGELG